MLFNLRTRDIFLDSLPCDVLEGDKLLWTRENRKHDPFHGMGWTCAPLSIAEIFVKWR